MDDCLTFYSPHVGSSFNFEIFKDLLQFLAFINKFYLFALLICLTFLSYLLALSLGFKSDGRRFNSRLLGAEIGTG